MKGPRRLSVLLSHPHLDHLIGLFGSQPFSDPDMEIHLYGQTAGGMEADALRFKIMRNREGDTVGVLQLSNAMDGEGAVRPFA